MFNIKNFINVFREEDNSIHNCPKLPNGDEDDEIAEVYTPEDPDDFDEWMANEYAPWDKDEVVKFEPAKLPTPPSKNPSVTTTFVETTSSLKLKDFI